MMKGQQEVLSIVLISGILIGVVGSVYLWGVPLIQKNKDIATLESAEGFIRNLNNRIKFVANNGGRDQLLINVPGIVRYDPVSETIQLIVETEGTIYATGADIPIGKNPLCTATTGTFGLDDPETICVKSVSAGEKSYTTTYTLKYLQLSNAETLRDFKIQLSGIAKTGGEQKTITFENLGSNTPTNIGGRTLVSTIIDIGII